MKKYLLFFLPFFALVANEPPTFCFGIGPGYRQDGHISVFYEDEIPSIDSTYENLKVPLVEALMEFFFYNFRLNLSADYGWIRGGGQDTKLNVIVGPTIIIPNFFHTDTDSGGVFDAVGTLGYEFSIISNRGLLFIPLGGYGVHYQGIKNDGTSPDPFRTTNFAGIPNSVLDVSISFSKLSRTWYGPFLGLAIFSHFLNRYDFEIAYAYHFLHLRQTQTISPNFFSFVTGVGIGVDTNVVIDTKISTGGAFGQQAKARFAFYITPCWKLSLVGDYYYFTTKVRRLRLNQTLTDNLTVPATVTDTTEHLPFKGRWRTYSIFLEILYCF